MASSIDKILFYINDSQMKKFTKEEVALAYELATEEYIVEKNRVIYASILLLDKQIQRLTDEYLIVKDSSGVESNEYQRIEDLINAIAQTKGRLQSEYVSEKRFSANGFGMRAKKTIIRGIND